MSVWLALLALFLCGACSCDARRGQETRATGSLEASTAPDPVALSPAAEPAREPARLPPEVLPAGPRDDPPVAPRPPSERAMELVHDGPITSATYSNGQPMFTGQQLEEQGKWLLHGRWDAWYEHGQAWEAGNYYLGQPHGLWEWWYEDGSPQARGEYDEGVHVGPWTYWHANGQVLASGVFRADEPVGVWRLYDEEGVLVDESDRGE